MLYKVEKYQKQPVWYKTILQKLKEIYLDYQNITKDDITNLPSKKRKLNDGSIQTKIGDFHHFIKFNIVQLEFFNSYIQP
ncbi:unnamed protein product [Rhizophagus irregularis]|nr:unnamed protein product [Rhizophagus irregularis]